MHKFFISKGISALAVLISLAALVFGCFLLYDGFKYIAEDVVWPIVYISMLLFGLFSLIQKILIQNFHKNSRLKFRVLLILNIIFTFASTYVSIDNEALKSIPLISLTWLVTIHLYYLSKTPLQDLNPNGYLQLRLIFTWLRSINYFKFFILIAIVFYLLILNEKSKNGRYLSFDNDNEIIDTRTGLVYELEGKNKGSYFFLQPQIPDKKYFATNLDFIAIKDIKEDYLQISLIKIIEIYKES